MAERQKIGFLGTGKMGGIIIEGMIAARLCAPGAVVVYDVDSAASKKLSERTGVSVAPGLKELSAECEVLFLCVKPQQFISAAEDIKKYVQGGLNVVSIMAGVKSGAIREALGGKVKALRVMPNVACLVGQGMAALARDTDAADDVKSFVFGLFESLGGAVWVDEKQMDAVTALSGSGPAYVFMMIEAMTDAGVSVGLDRATSQKLATQTVLGSAEMAKRSEFSLCELRAQVSSPAGTTVAATAVLERSGFRAAVIDAVIAARDRSRELGG